MCCACGGGGGTNLEVEDSDDAASVIPTETYNLFDSFGEYFKDPVTIITWVLGLIIPLITCIVVVLVC